MSRVTRLSERSTSESWREGGKRAKQTVEQSRRSDGAQQLLAKKETRDDCGGLQQCAECGGA